MTVLRRLSKDPLSLSFTDAGSAVNAVSARRASRTEPEAPRRVRVGGEGVLDRAHDARALAEEARLCRREAGDVGTRLDERLLDGVHEALVAERERRGAERDHRGGGPSAGVERVRLGLAGIDEDVERARVVDLIPVDDQPDREVLVTRSDHLVEQEPERRVRQACPFPLGRARGAR